MSESEDFFLPGLFGLDAQIPSNLPQNENDLLGKVGMAYLIGVGGAVIATCVVLAAFQPVLTFPMGLLLIPAILCGGVLLGALAFCVFFSTKSTGADNVSSDIAPKHNGDSFHDSSFDL